MGSKCHTLSDGFVIEEPFDELYDNYGSSDDTAGIARGGQGFDGGDRGDGGADEFLGSGELGGLGHGPVAQVSSFVPGSPAADGDAPPGFNLETPPLARGLGAMGRVQPIQPTGSVPLHRQPIAQPGERLVNYAHPNVAADNPWYHGPPLASSLKANSYRDTVDERPACGPSGRAGGGARPKTMAEAVNPGCIRSDDERPTVAQHPQGGATSQAVYHPREGANRRDAFPALVSMDGARVVASRLLDDPLARPTQRETPVLPEIRDGPRVPIYSARRGTPTPRDSGPILESHRNTYHVDWHGASSDPHPRVAPNVTHSRPPPPLRDCVGPYEQAIGLNPRVPMHIDSKTALKALNGEFIQLEWFLDNNSCNDYESVDHGVDSMLRPLRPRKLITSLYKWMEAWGHYEVTLVSSYGLDMYYELASYRSFILSLTDKYKIPFILTYDERHRAALGRARSFDFSYFNNQLFVTIFDVSSLRAVTKCTKCASSDHGTKDCPFRGGAPAGGVSTQGSGEKFARAGKQSVDPSEICIRFQDGSCRFRKCPRRHCCLLCGGPKGAKSCDDCASKKGTAPTPKN